MIVWTGWGALALLVPLAFTAALSAAGTALGASPEGLNPGSAIGLLAGAVAVWFLGRRLNRGASLDELRAGHPGPRANRHTLFWIPMQWWAPVQGVGAVVAAVVTVVA